MSATTIPKTVLITGASRGIGAAIAYKLASTGEYRLLLNGNRNKEKLYALIEQIKNSSPNCECAAMICDIANPNALNRSFFEVTSTFGTPDILINNAGIAHIGRLQDMEEEDIEALISTNLTAAIRLSRLCIPHMLHRIHSMHIPSESDYAPTCGILNISSVWGSYGASCETVYSATKGGIHSFTKALAKELAPSTIPVNAIACGMVATDMNTTLSLEEQNEIREQIPAGRIASPEEIAALVALILKAPAYMTGQIITMDGGWI